MPSRATPMSRFRRLVVPCVGAAGASILLSLASCQSPSSGEAAGGRGAAAGRSGGSSALPGARVRGEPITTSSGLKYYDLVIGDGPAPAGDETAVLVHYDGWLTDGTKFDSSRDRGEPTCFLLGSVIRGWTEGLGTMRVGGSRKLIVPGVLAYGERGAPQAGIGPDATLIFDVELLALDPFAGAPTALHGEPVHGPPTTTEHGTTYYELAEGSGEPFGSDSAARVSFVMYRNDGKELVRGGPVDVTQRGLLPGMVQAMQGMRAGGRRKMVIPPDQAYGPAGRLPQIPPKALLVVDMTLVAVDPWSEVPETLPGEPVTGAPVTTASGLTYYDLAVGTGETPPPGALVKVHYTGWLVDGQKFGSSQDDGEPFVFNLSGGVIQGWIEGVQSMQVGGTRKLVIPYDLGYGVTGRPPRIPPKATLIFDVELLEIIRDD